MSAKIVSSRVKKEKDVENLKNCHHDLLFLHWRPLESNMHQVCEPFCQS
jgi:hypothetical protein